MISSSTFNCDESPAVFWKQFQVSDDVCMFACSPWCFWNFQILGFLGTSNFGTVEPTELAAHKEEGRSWFKTAVNIQHQETRDKWFQDFDTDHPLVFTFSFFNNESRSVESFGFNEIKMSFSRGLFSRAVVVGSAVCIGKLIRSHVACQKSLPFDSKVRTSLITSLSREQSWRLICSIVLR